MSEFFQGEVVGAASKLVTGEDRRVERDYEAIESRIEELIDKGFPAAEAWLEADPTGEIRLDIQRKESAEQRSINEAGASAIRQTEYEQRVAEAKNTIFDPEELERALTRLRAEEILKAQKRNRRA